MMTRSATWPASGRSPGEAVRRVQQEVTLQWCRAKIGGRRNGVGGITTLGARGMSGGAAHGTDQQHQAQQRR